MKKFVCIALTVLLAVGLCACGKNKVAKDAFRLSVQNHTGENIRGINLRVRAAGGDEQLFYLGRGDGGVIAPGELLTQDFKTADLGQTAEHLLDVEIRMSVITGDSRSVDAVNTVNISVVTPGETYYYNMDGSASTGYHLSKTSRTY